MGLLAGNPAIIPTLSLAGVTRNPVLPQINHRIGGFGGAEVLANYIKNHNIAALICATHPFAKKMPFNAMEAAKLAGIHLLYLLRPAWQKQADDNWLEVETHEEAIKQLGEQPARVFLTVGRLEIEKYASAPQHFYLIRSIDEITDKPIKNAVYIATRPPFSIENERALMKQHKIDYLITKNSGGSATEAKITAARELEIPVILIKRPPRPEGKHVATAKEALEWLLKLDKT